MSQQEVIRRSRPEDIPQLSELFREVFRSERPPEIWSWKYFGERESVAYVCEAEGRIVAHAGGIPVQFRDGSREYVAHQSVDFMSSPSYAGGLGPGGVFVRTVRRMFEDCCGAGKALLVYGFPGERHRIVGEKLLGYEPLELVTELTLPTAANSESAQPLTTRTLPALMNTGFSCGAVRDAAYLSWRYLHHPVHRYGAVAVKKRWSRQLQAAGLVREADDHFLLMELSPLDNRSAARLMDKLARLGKPVKTWTSAHHPVGLLLASHGFRATARDHWVEYRFFFERVRPAPGELYYTLGDYDVH